ncbi:MAG: SpoIIE family protein phosphatase [Crocinitomicaceae bacterium]
MKQLTFQKKVLIMLVAVLFIAILSAVFVNNSLQSIVEEISEESEIDENLVLLKGMMADISDAESSVKSYGLTKNEDYLDDYNIQLNAVNQKILELRETVEPGSELEKGLPKIDSLVVTKFEILDELLVVQSQRSADLILDKVLAKVEDANINESNTVENNTTNEGEDNTPVVTENVDESGGKKKFFDRLFGNRKKKKEEEKNQVNEVSEVSDTLSQEDVEEVVESSINRIDKELESLRKKETEYEVALKMKELELIQADKHIMDEISEVVETLEAAEKVNLEEKIAFAEEQRGATHTHILLFCLLTCALLALAGYAVYVYVRKNDAFKKALRQAKFETDTKNKEITDSINYAKRIQSAIMPDDKKILKAFPNSFVFYRPKDIVAGDFYWMVQTEQYNFVAVADCTGHGVPGAMVSVACSSALNRSLKEFGLIDPGKILGKSREIVIETFEEGNKVLYDGMDICLCRIDRKTGELQYAGANNSLYFFKNGTLQEIKADKQPVARFYKTEDFTTHAVDVSKGDNIYLFTDGMPDQFGGPKQKKFMYKRFKELLEKHAERSPQDQEIALDHALKSWKGDLEQIDDICVIGIRL